VVLMDIRMPEMDGLQATARIVDELGGAVRVLILTTFEPDEYVYRALPGGASGFVLKDIPPGAARRRRPHRGRRRGAARAVGDPPADRRVRRAAGRRPGARRPAAELTHGERDVVTAVAQGPQQRRDRRRAVHRTRRP
jgi:DNA-binding NarL/FixJ family response regulator